MYKNLLVAYDDSPESRKALLAGIEIAKMCNAGLRAVTVEEGLPVYVTASTPYGAMSTEVVDDLRLQRDQFYANLQKEAKEIANSHGVELDITVIPGNEVETIAAYASEIKADLLMVGYHKHSMILDRILGSTGHSITLAAPCSVLAVK